MQRLEVSGAVRPLQGSLGVNEFKTWKQRERNQRDLSVRVRG